LREALTGPVAVRWRAVAFLFLTVLAAVARAQSVPLAGVQTSLLHELFHDHAVLQRDQPIAVWGRAANGETVTVTLGTSTVRARADASGRWSTQLPAMAAGGPYELTALGSSGARQAVQDILLGDVFLCSGQSNMEMQVLRASNSYDEIRKSANDTIRLAGIHQAINPAPLTHFQNPVGWQVASPETVPDWSAVCFFFARELQSFTHVPIGLIQSTWGGSNIRPWISAAALQALGGYESGLGLLRLYARDPAAAQNQFAHLWEQWWRAGSGDRPGSKPWIPRRLAQEPTQAAGPAQPPRRQSAALTEEPAGQWRTLPSGLGDWRSWGVPALADFTGALWYRTRINLTPAQALIAASGSAKLSLGAINQVDETWINGRALGSTFGYETDRTYEIPHGRLHAGENVLVVNVLTTYGPGGLLAKGERRALHLPGGESIPLTGVWEYSVVPSAVGTPPRAPWESVGGLSTMYNAMIAPLGGYGLRAVLWYQGESNNSEPQSYRSLLETLMADWRRQFGRDLPFLIVQLPNYGALSTAPTESGWAQVREAQRLAVAHDPHAGLAVTIDIGDPHNLHPTNKQDVALRLANAARHVIFGESTPPSGPLPVSATRDSNGIVIDFTDVEGGLVAYSHATPIAFELCDDAPHSCRFAAAQIEGSRVMLPVPTGSSPTRVRYCWADSPVCTLADVGGLPAVPFELRVLSPPVHLGGEQDHARIMMLPAATGVAATTAAEATRAAGALPPAAALARPQITGVSHIAVYATDPARTERFYVHDLGAIKGDDPENPKGVRYYFAPTQFVEVLPIPTGSASINRLDHAAFTTTDAQALRNYLAAQKFAVPRKVDRGGDGSRWFDVIDPEGNRIEFMQPPANTPDVPVNSLSNHIIHVGFIVHNRALEDSFFRAVLGFRPYWFGGMKDDTPTWVSQQVPDGTDWLEYMIVGTPDGRGIPSTMSRADLGVLDHFSLGVRDARAAYTLLWNADRLAGQSNTPKIGRDAKWQLNLLDPDGTRAEIMELHAIGTPCCSPFTASDPQN
jgi:sialate O-acetylesterase